VAQDETQALWREYAQTKDQGIRDRLILTYAPLVKYVAGRLGSGLPAHVDENSSRTAFSA
jgi:RNA polymerase sigma factor FliA